LEFIKSVVDSSSIFKSYKLNGVDGNCKQRHFEIWSATETKSLKIIRSFLISRSEYIPEIIVIFVML